MLGRLCVSLPPTLEIPDRQIIPWCTSVHAGHLVVTTVYAINMRRNPGSARPLAAVDHCQGHSVPQSHPCLPRRAVPLDTPPALSEHHNSTLRRASWDPSMKMLEASSLRARVVCPINNGSGAGTPALCLKSIQVTPLAEWRPIPMPRSNSMSQRFSGNHVSATRVAPLNCTRHLLAKSAATANQSYDCCRASSGGKGACTVRRPCHQSPRMPREAADHYQLRQGTVL